MREHKESALPCPDCGNSIQVVLEPYNEMAGLVECMAGGKTLHFMGKATCSCGKTVVASLHITSGDWRMA